MLCYMYVTLVLLFFFFKQKTAYEMRISDWSSDVCSSDLGTSNWCVRLRYDRLVEASTAPSPTGMCAPNVPDSVHFGVFWNARWLATSVPKASTKRSYLASRSEEHTFELQSLMRISYAVFCLKKNNKRIEINYTNEN